MLKLHIQGKNHEIPLIIPPMKKTLILAGCIDLAKTYKKGRLPPLAQAQSAEPDKCKALTESVADVVQASFGYAGEATERLMALKPLTGERQPYSEVQIKEIREWIIALAKEIELGIRGKSHEWVYLSITDPPMKKILILAGCTDLAKTYKEALPGPAKK